MLTDKGANRGLWFDREMMAFCGKVFRVHARVTQIIDERTGEMISLTSDCIMLENGVCSGELSTGRWFCPVRDLLVLAGVLARASGRAGHRPERRPVRDGGSARLSRGHGVTPVLDVQQVPAVLGAVVEQAHDVVGHRGEVRGADEVADGRTRAGGRRRWSPTARRRCRRCARCGSRSRTASRPSGWGRWSAGAGPRTR